MAPFIPWVDYLADVPEIVEREGGRERDRKREREREGGREGERITLNQLNDHISIPIICEEHGPTTTMAVYKSVLINTVLPVYFIFQNVEHLLLTSGRIVIVSIMYDKLSKYIIYINILLQHLTYKLQHTTLK